ncbi:MAG TPA: methylated-DNA--[protein]-cysteine S-methyltransferase [Thermodesulfovibrionales bacterium]|nr:methylated-DNA--[protein]-cysteine S-methyltransferase [Thermodesulfovibrionales bacterium]
MNRRGSTEDYRRIEKAILFLEKNVHRQPDLKEIAATLSLSEYHFQRLFRRWAGISPKRFLQFLTVEHAKQVMKRAGSLLDVTYQVGLSSSGRLHDLFVSVEGVTPGEFRARGDHLTIRYGFHATPFGKCLIAVTDRGISNLAFIEEGGQGKAVGELKRYWRHAVVREDPSATRGYVERIFGPVATDRSLKAFLKGTNFQIKVWQALLAIPRASVTSYEAIATEIGRPGAVRAVANAVGRNPLAYLIPCHRVIRKSGVVGGYRWGGARKKAMLVWETAQKEKELQ